MPAAVQGLHNNMQTHTATGVVPLGVQRQRPASETDDLPAAITSRRGASNRRRRNVATARRLNDVNHLRSTIRGNLQTKCQRNPQSHLAHCVSLDYPSAVSQQEPRNTLGNRTTWYRNASDGVLAPLCCTTLTNNTNATHQRQCRRWRPRPRVRPTSGDRAEMRPPVCKMDVAAAAIVEKNPSVVCTQWLRPPAPNKRHSDSCKCVVSVAFSDGLQYVSKQRREGGVAK